MLPVVASPAATRMNILVYAVLTALSGLLPTLLGFAGIGYAIVAAGLGAWLVQRAELLRRATAETERRHAGRLFGVSILYLFALFGALMADSVISGLLS